MADFNVEFTIDDKTYNLHETKILVDDELSAASENPVQNKVITGEINDLKADISELSLGVPTNVRQAIKALFESAAYAETGLTDEMAVVSSWASQVTAISLNNSTISISGASTSQLVATTTPSGGTVTWTSSDTSVATVSSSGLVTGVSNGTAIITATSGDVSATCTVAVSGFATLTSISAVYTQSGTVYPTDSLDSLKTDLVVTAHYDDQSTATVTSYTLSGTLTVGTSTITVSYDGKTTTFSVTVSAASSYVTDGLIHHFDAIDNTPNGHDSTSTTWTDLVGTDVLTMNDSTKATWDNDALVLGGTAGQYLIGTDTTEAPASTTVEVVFEADANQSAMVAILMAYSTSACIGAIPVFSDNTFNVKGGSSSTYTHSGSDLTSLYHIAGSYTSNNAINKAYANGSLATTGSATHSLTFSSSVNKRIIGQSNTSSSGQTYPFKGKIYAIRIYNKVLTDAEIAQNYAIDVVRFGLGS